MAHLKLETQSADAQTSLSPIQQIVADMRAGKLVILVDDEDRENEGDLVLAAEFASRETINFMARYGRGLICLTLTEKHCQQLNLALMVRDNRSSHGTNFMVSIESAKGVTTGISAQDRAHTIKVAVAANAKPEDIVQPGHIFPLRAQKGGVLMRAGHTEAGCDLAQLAGLRPAAVICEILKEDGSMARLPDLVSFARTHGLNIGSIADLIHYRIQHESLVERVAERPINTFYGKFQLVAYVEKNSNQTHLALVKGPIYPDREVLVRVHEPVSIMDFLDKENTEHSFSIDHTLKMIQEADAGVLVLLCHSETSEELLNRVATPSQNARPRKKWDPRFYGIGAQILRNLHVRKMCLMATPKKMPSMAGYDLEVTRYYQES